MIAPWTCSRAHRKRSLDGRAVRMQGRPPDGWLLLVPNSVHTGAADRRPLDGTLRDAPIVLPAARMHQRSGSETFGVSGRG